MNTGQIDHSICNKEMANWEKLRQEILKLIAGRLAIEDFLAFGRVCTAWQSAATKETYKAKLKSLWLMTWRYKHMAKFSSLSTGRIYPARLPASPVHTLSALGWILLSDRRGEYRIFNPISGVSIKLPSLESLGGIDKMALSSSPSSSGSYTVMISHCGSPGFAFLRSGEDAWTVVSPVMHLPRCMLHGLVYYNGQFVALDAQDQIMSLDERKCRMESRLVLGLDNVEGYEYLVECLGSLLVVLTIDEGYYRPVKKILVFKVDLEKGTKEEVKSLGNASLFLSGNSSFSVEFNAESCLPGIKPNRVYFPDFGDRIMKTYSMEDGEVETYFDAAGSHIDIDKYEAEWFQPDF